MSAIAITGISGFLGSHIKSVLESDGLAVVSLPREFRKSSGAMKSWLGNHKPAGLIHLAGIVDVRFCSEHPLEAFQSHVLETANLLEGLRQEAPKTPVIYVASDKSFGEQENCGLLTSYQPSFPYETSKACEDLLVETYARTFGLPLFLARFPNFFGEGDRHVERLIPGICLSLGRGKEFVVRTRLDGTIRQYIYVRDAAAIVANALSEVLAGRSFWPKSHFGPSNLKTVGQVIKDLETVTARKLNLKVLNLPGEVSRLSINDENDLHYPYTDWLPALHRTAQWYLERCESGMP